MAKPDYILDIGSLKTRASALGEIRPAPKPRDRPWLAIRWRCCEVYSRIYRNRAGTAYKGCCPGCRRDLTIPIGAEGTSHRFFDSY